MWVLVLAFVINNSDQQRTVVAKPMQTYEQCQEAGINATAKWQNRKEFTYTYTCVSTK